MARARELVVSLAERGLRSRYKQAFLGIAWAVLTPLAFLVVMSVVFQQIGNIDTGEVPYPLFAFLGLVPWNFFAGSMSSGGMALLENVTLLNKISCPVRSFRSPASWLRRSTL